MSGLPRRVLVYLISVTLVVPVLPVTGWRLNAAEADETSGGSSPNLQTIDAFLQGPIAPAYRVISAQGRLLLDICRGNETCIQDMKQALPTKKQILAAGWEQTNNLVHAVVNAIASDGFVAQSAANFFTKYGRPVSPRALNGLHKSNILAKWGNRLFAFVEVVKGVLDMTIQFRAGDYLAMIQTALKTGLKVLSILKSGWLANFLCLAAGAASFGAGAVVCIFFVSVIIIVLSDMVDDLVGDFGGKLIYEGGKSIIEIMKSVKTACVDRVDGFVEEFCTVTAVICFTSLSLAYRFCDIEASLIDPLPDSDSIPVPGGSGGGVPVPAVPLGRGAPVGPGLGGDGDVSGPVVQPPSITATPRTDGIPGESGEIRVRGDLDIHIRVDGSIVTEADSGGEAITRIGSTVQGADEVGGTYVTDIGGSVINRGGVIEINPIGRSCEAVRNGQCCEKIDRGRCVIDIRKRSREKDCPSGYKRRGKYCYEYADRDHRLRLD